MQLVKDHAQAMHEIVEQVNMDIARLKALLEKAGMLPVEPDYRECL